MAQVPAGRPAAVRFVADFRALGQAVRDGRRIESACRDGRGLGRAVTAKWGRLNASPILACRATAQAAPDCLRPGGPPVGPTGAMPGWSPMRASPGVGSAGHGDAGPSARWAALVPWPGVGCREAPCRETSAPKTSAHHDARRIGPGPVSASAGALPSPDRCCTLASTSRCRPASRLRDRPGDRSRFRCRRVGAVRRAGRPGFAPVPSGGGWGGEAPALQPGFVPSPAARRFRDRWLGPCIRLQPTAAAPCGLACDPQFARCPFPTFDRRQCSGLRNFRFASFLAEKAGLSTRKFAGFPIPKPRPCRLEISHYP